MLMAGECLHLREILTAVLQPLHETVTHMLAVVMQLLLCVVLVADI